MKTGTIILIVVSLAVVLGGCGFMQVHNRLVTEREDFRKEWSQVDAGLQFRSDLIPNLVETVKGYAKEETEVIKSITDARAAMTGARTPQEKIAADNQLSGALARLLVVSENYPNLKANANFLELQRSLEGAENRIFQARRRYNDSLQTYNADLERSPANIVASLSGLQREDAYFKTDPGARVAPKVQF